MTDSIRARALSLGFTSRIEVEAGAYDLTLWVSPETDLDGAFYAICDATGDRLLVQGWNVTIHTPAMAA